MPLFNIAGKYANVLGKGLGAARDFVLDRFVPRPEAHFIKSMTGGGAPQTTMTPTELSKIKRAYQQQKQRPVLSAEELYQNMLTNYEEAKNAPPLIPPKTNSDKKSQEQLNKFIKLAGMANVPPPTFGMAEDIVQAEQAARKDPVTSLYGYGRDMRMAYGNLSVYPQPDGGVRIYDRYKVDKDLFDQQDQVDRVGDLQEGGPIPSLIYNAANRLGTYKPFDIDVRLSADEWQRVNPAPKPERNPQSPSQLRLENQGSILNTLNNIYQKFRPQPTINAPIGVPIPMTAPMINPK